MPDPQHQPDPADVEGFDPDLAEDEQSGRRLNLSTVQIGASAGAAVTSALAASFFGVAGTLIGAAVGSIVSTVAGALYAESMRRAALRVRTTQAIVVRKVAAPDVVPQLRAGPEHTGTSTTRTVPFAQAGPPTMGRPTVAPPTAVPPTVAQTTVADPAVMVPARTSWWRRRPVQLGAMMLAGFVIALGVITVAEGVIGGSVSGDRGTSTVGRVFGQTGSDPTTTPTVPPSPSTSTSPTPGASGSAPASQAPVAPTASATTAPTTAPTAGATTAPTASSSDGAAQDQPQASQDTAVTP